MCADHNDVELLVSATAAPTGATLQSTAPKTGGGTHNPPSGALKWTRMEGPNSISNSATSYPGTSGGDEMDLAYVVGTFLINATLGANETGRICGWNMREDDQSGVVTVNLEWVRVTDGTHFNLRLTTGNPASGSARTTLATGGTAFTTDEPISFRCEADGSNLTLFGKENGDVSSVSTAEFIHGFTKLIYSRSLSQKAFDDLGSGEYIYHDALALIEADAKADRPDSDIIVSRLNPNADGASNGYDDETCGVGGTEAAHADVLLSSDAVNSAIYWCEVGGEAGAQSVLFDTFDISKQMLGIEVRSSARANVGAKTVTTTTELSDDNESSYTTARLTVNINWDTTFRLAYHCFEIPASAGEWQDQNVTTVLDAIVIKVTSNSNNGANDEWAAVVPQVYEVGSDALGQPEGVKQVVMF